jgi:hypothetical protein
MDKIVDEIFKEIHETYESYDGGLIHLDNTSEDQIKESIKKAINYTRCCKSDSELLKSEIDTEFEKFVEANTNKQKIAPMYWHNDKCF